MHETGVIFRRELRSFFLSPVAYVFGVLFLIVQLYISVTGTLEQGALAGMQGFFQLLPMILLFFIPALTMRTWAEERKLGTLELLMTFPVRVPHLVLGKFLAALCYLAFILLLTAGLPVTLSLFADLDWGPVIGAYLGSLFLASAYLAVGMFFSSLTRDQIVALLVSLVFLGLLYWLGSAGVLEALQRYDLTDWLAEFFGAVSPFRYFHSIARGVIDTRDILYYVVFCGFFLYTNALVLHHRRHRG